MRLDILGICGTFMGGIALIARESGHRVTGADAGIYPPMSTLLSDHGVRLREGFSASEDEGAADVTVVGNALGRGNPAVERLLDDGRRFTSGPQWLAENVLADRWVLAVSGTHGKTTTACMLAWILEYAGYDPGFLIGGVPGNFPVSARRGGGGFFVVEADEYDTAFFDKRSKFVHFRPRTLVLNNLEYDHADIFPDLAAIQRQFHHLVRTVPGQGQILVNGDDHALDDTLAMGCWSERVRYGTGPDCDWRLERGRDGWTVESGVHRWALKSPLPGEHNARNALAAILAARHVGVLPDTAIEALTRFRGVRRRLDVLGEAGGVTVIDDFAHHPTAVAATLSALRECGAYRRLLAVLEPRSNTMRLGIHRDRLGAALENADLVFCYQPPALDWPLQPALAPLGDRVRIHDDVADLASQVVTRARPGDAVIVMSNGGFGNIHQRLLDGLTRRADAPE